MLILLVLFFFAWFCLGFCLVLCLVLTGSKWSPVINSVLLGACDHASQLTTSSACRHIARLRGNVLLMGAIAVMAWRDSMQEGQRAESGAAGCPVWLRAVVEFQARHMLGISAALGGI